MNVVDSVTAVDANTVTLQPEEPLRALHRGDDRDRLQHRLAQHVAKNFPTT